MGIATGGGALCAAFETCTMEQDTLDRKPATSCYAALDRRLRRPFIVPELPMRTFHTPFSINILLLFSSISHLSIPISNSPRSICCLVMISPAVLCIPYHRATIPISYHL